MKVSFVILAHEPPEKLRQLICALLGAGSNVYLHHDAAAKGDMETSVAEWAIDALPGKIYFAKSVKVVWGEWSIVKATLNCLDLVKKYDIDSDYFVLLSGSCMPVKPIALLKNYLSASKKDHIEAVDAEKFRWITAGIQKERWQQYHVFNWRYQRRRFDLSLRLQKKLGVKRRLPLRHQAHMGSQWWCLRRNTIMSIISLVESNASLEAFYKKTWVPDELFFQTLVANLVPPREISDELVTRYRFNDMGVPRVYYDDALAKLLGESKFFVRKVSHSASMLREELGKIAVMDEAVYNTYLDQNQKRYLPEIQADLRLRQERQKGEWHSLTGHRENRYDFIKSIPNEIVVVAGGSADARRSVMDSLRAFDDLVVYGDIFDSSKVDAGDESVFIGVGPNSIKLARHTWHQVLGDIAYIYNEKTIVISLGDNAFGFLEVLKWKHNVRVFLLDESHRKSVAEIDQGNLRRASQLYHKLEDRYCQLAVGSAEFFSRSLEELCNADHSWRFSLQCMIAAPRGANVLAVAGDKYRTLMAGSEANGQIGLDRVLFLLADEEADAAIFYDSLVDGLGFAGIRNPFSVGTKKDHAFDAEFYISQLLSVQRKSTEHVNTVVFIGLNDVPKLEFLTRDNRATVVYLASNRDRISELTLTAFGLGSQLERIDETQADEELLVTYMQGRRGAYLVYRPEEIKKFKSDIRALFQPKDTAKLA